jgi:hypothetical protein
MREAMPLTDEQSDKDRPTTTHPQRIVWLVLGVLVTCATLTLGSLVARAWLDNSGTASTVVQHHSYQRPVSRIVLDFSGSGAGSVTLLPGPATQVRVERELGGHDKPSVAETWHEGTLHVQIRCSARSWLSFGNHCSAGYTMWIPPDVFVDARISTGDLHVHDLTGNMSLAMGTGDISLESTSGSVTARSGTGDLTVRGRTGAMSLGTGRGDIRLTNSTGAVQAHIDRGDLIGAGLRSPDLIAQIRLGDAHLTFATAPRTVTATTLRGNADIALPDGRYRIIARAASGQRIVDVVSASDATSAITARSARGDVDIHYAN